MNLCLFLITFYLFPSLISIAFCVKKCGLLSRCWRFESSLSSYRCRGTKEFTRKWDLIQMIYEISTFPEVLSLGTSYQCYEWIAHLEAFFFLKLTTVSSKMWIVCLKNFINCISTHISLVLTIGFIIHHLQFNRLCALIYLQNLWYEPLCKIWIVTLKITL